MIRYKEGVSVLGIKPEILAIYPIIEAAFAPKEAIITSAGEKVKIHGKKSYHYIGYAIDLRTHHLIDGEARKILQLLRTWLTSEYDVGLEFEGTEDEHIHIEFDLHRASFPS